MLKLCKGQKKLPTPEEGSVEVFEDDLEDEESTAEEPGRLASLLSSCSLTKLRSQEWARPVAR